MSALAPRATSKSAVALLQDFDDAAIEAAKNLIAPDAPDHIIKLVLYRCQQLGCDPFARMIYAINRPRKTGAKPLECDNCHKTTVFASKDGGWFCWRKKDGCGKTWPADFAPFLNAPASTVDNWVLQSSIDLFRAEAESASGYKGQDGPYWCGDDGVWLDYWISPKPPRGARIGILRSEFPAPIYTFARFDSYAQTDAEGKLTGLWAKMPEVMIAKCAEALAIRRTFPAKLSGLYIAEEMDQESNVPIAPAAPVVEAVPPVASKPALVAVASPAIAAAETIEAEPPAFDHTKHLEEVTALARQLSYTPARVALDLERLGNDAGALVASYQAKLAQKPVRAGRTAQPEPEAAKVEEPAAAAPEPAKTATPAKVRASVTRARLAFDGTPWHEREERLTFAAWALGWDKVDTFNDLSDNDLKHVLGTLDEQIAAGKKALAESNGELPLG